MLPAGNSETGLTGSAEESTEDTSEPLNMGSCWCEVGSGRLPEDVDEMLERDEKKPPNFFVNGGAVTGAGGGALETAGEAVGLFATAVAFHNLKLQLVFLREWSETVGCAGGAGALRPGGCMPILFSAINVLSALAHVSEAS